MVSYLKQGAVGANCEQANLTISGPSRKHGLVPYVTVICWTAFCLVPNVTLQACELICVENLESRAGTCSKELVLPIAALCFGVHAILIGFDVLGS